MTKANNVEAPINAGAYTVKITVGDGDNFTAVSDLEVGSFTIICNHTLNTNSLYTDN